MKDDRDLPRGAVAVRTDATALAAGHKLHAALLAQLRKRGTGETRLSAIGAAPWEASFFGLDRVADFRDAPAETRARILHDCAQGLLDEAYGVEKLGMAYCAKLILASETTEERMAYSLIASDEAMHLHAVTPFVDHPELAGRGPFFALLHGAVEGLPKAALVFLMQSVLEGWGLSHYRSLAEGCVDARLAQVLRRIVADEAFHVGTGNVLFEPSRLRDGDRAAMIDFLRQMLGMVAVGPQGVVGALERGLGGFDPARRTRAFTELASERTSSERMQVLRGLVGGCPELLQRLDEHGAFAVHPPDVCASVASS